MICLIALFVCGVLGIFSATHRKIAREAFECVFKRIRLKPCESGLDQRLKSIITGKLMRKAPKFAGFTYRHFEAISWTFTILMVVSIAYSGIGVYNFVVYGNCNGEYSQAECVYSGLGDALSTDVSCVSPLCQNKECVCKDEINCPERVGEVCNESCYLGG